MMRFSLQLFTVAVCWKICLTDAFGAARSLRDIALLRHPCEIVTRSDSAKRFYCELDPRDTPSNYTGLHYHIENLPNNFSETDGYSGYLGGEGIRLDHEKFVLTIEPTSTVSFTDTPTHGRRKLRIDRAYDSPKVLAVIVNALDTTNPFLTQDEVACHVYGCPDDNYNMASQFSACSFGKFTPQPFVGTINGISINGVFFIFLARAIMDLPAKTNILGDEIEGFAVQELNAQLGDFRGQGVDFVMLFLPPTNQPDTLLTAYAYYPGGGTEGGPGWLSVYSANRPPNRPYQSPNDMLHEIGHNLGLGHSNNCLEQPGFPPYPILPTDDAAACEYEDDSNVMGRVQQRTDEGGMYCFGGEHYRNLGWVDDKLFIQGGLSALTQYTIGGIADYANPSVVTVLLYLDLDPSSDIDYNVVYNRQTGINSGVTKSPNHVMVTRGRPTTQAGQESYVICDLEVGQSCALIHGLELVNRQTKILTFQALIELEPARRNLVSDVYSGDFESQELIDGLLVAAVAIFPAESQCSDDTIATKSADGNCEACFVSDDVEDPYSLSGTNCFREGTWVVDAGGCYSSVVVTDDNPPLFHGALIASVDVQCASDVPDPPVVTVSDNCDGSAKIRFAAQVNGSLDVDAFTVTRIWTTTDRTGNAAVLTQEVTVLDDTPPVFGNTPPTPVHVQCLSDVPDPADPSVSDNCDDFPAIISYSESATNGDCEDKFTLSRTWTAADKTGNDAHFIQEIFVNDNTGPVITCNTFDISPNQVNINSPITFRPKAVDNCSEALEVKIESFECVKRGGKKSKSCKVELSGDVASVFISGGVGSRIDLHVLALDRCGNESRQVCEIHVVNPNNV